MKFFTSFRQKLVATITGFIFSSPLLAEFNKEQIVKNLSTVDQDVKKIQGEVDTTVLTSGETMLLAVAVIAFTWVSYSAVAKFRECQKGMADWSEMIVLGVAAAALLFLVSLLISNAAGLLTSTA